MSPLPAKSRGQDGPRQPPSASTGIACGTGTGTRTYRPGEAFPQRLELLQARVPPQLRRPRRRRRHAPPVGRGLRESHGTGAGATGTHRPRSLPRCAPRPHLVPAGRQCGREAPQPRPRPQPDSAPRHRLSARVPPFPHGRHWLPALLVTHRALLLAGASTNGAPSDWLFCAGGSDWWKCRLFTSRLLQASTS